MALEGVPEHQRPSCLSLQSQCLLYLVFNLEEVAPAALALLPARLRTVLLRSLPAVDICTLERTSVAEGIAMNASVWEHVFKERSTTFPSLVVLNERATDPKGRLDYRSNYLGNVTSAALHGNVFLDVQHSDKNPTKNAVLQARMLLFGVPSQFEEMGNHFTSLPSPPCPQVCDWVIPRRFASLPAAQHYVHVPYSELAFMKILTATCHYFPDDVCIDCERFGSSPVGTMRNFFQPSVFTDFLSRLKQLTCSITCSGSQYCKSAVGIPKFVLETAFTSENPQLKALTLKGPLNFITNCLPQVSAFLSDSELHPGQCTKVGALRNGYAGLESLSIAVDSKSGSVSPYVHFCLVSIMQHQSALREVFLCSYDFRYAAAGMQVDLVATLAALFKDKRFRRLHIEGTIIPHSALEVLIGGYLSSPCSCMQTLSFVDVVFEATCNCFPVSTELRALIPPDDAINFKNLVFKVVGFVTPLFQWLSRLPCLVLHTLELSSMSAMEGTDQVLRTLAGIPALQIANLILESTPFETPSLQSWEKIIGNPHLKALSLKHSTFSVEGLIRGLRKQALVGSLEGLTLTAEDELPAGISEAIQELPMLAKLTLVPQRKN